MTLFTASSPRARHRGAGFRPDRHAETFSKWFDAAKLTAQQIPPTSPNEAPQPTPGPEMPEPPLPPIKPPPSENPVPVKEPPTVSPPVACGSARVQYA